LRLTVVQPTVQGLRRLLGRLRQALGGASGRRGQMNNASRLLKQPQQNSNYLGFASAGIARQHGDR